MALDRQPVKIAQFPVALAHIMVSDVGGCRFMENRQEYTESHEDREVRKLVKRIEETQAAREAQTKKTLDDYGKTVGD